MTGNRRIQKKEEVLNFLFQFKKLAGNMGRNTELAERGKNFQTIIKLNLTILRAKEILLTLTYKNYISGPYKREDGPGNLWEFILVLDGNAIYIKLCDDFSNCFPLCISFHEPEKPFKLFFED